MIVSSQYWGPSGPCQSISGAFFEALDISLLNFQKQPERRFSQDPIGMVRKWWPVPVAECWGVGGEP